VSVHAARRSLIDAFRRMDIPLYLTDVIVQADGDATKPVRTISRRAQGPHGRGFMHTIALTPDEMKVAKKITCQAPANTGGIGLDARGKPLWIVWHPKELRTWDDLCGLIHEFAHVAVKKDPDDVNEINSPMLAVEAALHQHCNVPDMRVSRWMCRFGIDSWYWPDAPWGRRVRVLHVSLQRGMQAGLLTERGELLWRKP
jgi:hypothetical protein